MLNKNYIKEISDLYGIPKSTLRYWHSEGLIHFDRDSSNDYRKFSLKTIIDTGDIAFYRSLNMPIEDLKHLHERNADELEDIIKNSGRKLEEQILSLQESMKKIDTRIKRIHQYRNFLQHPYSLGKPDFQKLVANNFEPEYHLKYISDPYSAAILFPFKDKDKFEYAFVADDDYQGRDVLWNVNDSSKNFVHCLLKVDNNCPNGNCLDEHREYFHGQGFEMGDAVGRYLFTAYDKRLYDYHEGWIEIR